MAGDWQSFFYLVFFDMEDTERRSVLGSSGHGCSGNRDVIVVRTWMLWPFASHEATKCRKYRCFCMEVIIVRTWMLWPLRTQWSHKRYHRADMDALATRTLSSCGHGCSGNTDVTSYHCVNMDALVTRTLSSCGHGCSAKKPRNAPVTGTLSSCGHGCSGHSQAMKPRSVANTVFLHGGYHRKDMDKRYHRADMDALVTRTLSSCGHGCSGSKQPLPSACSWPAPLPKCSLS